MQIKKSRLLQPLEWVYHDDVIDVSNDIYDILLTLDLNNPPKDTPIQILNLLDVVRISPPEIDYGKILNIRHE